MTPCLLLAPCFENEKIDDEGIILLEEEIFVVCRQENDRLLAR
jgi:hypothetical protein